MVQDSSASCAAVTCYERRKIKFVLPASMHITQVQRELPENQGDAMQLDNKLEALRDYVSAHLDDLATVSSRSLKAVLAGGGTLRRGLSTNSSGPAQNASQKLSGVMATRRLLCSCTIARAAAMHTLLPKLQPQSRNVHFNRTVVAASCISAAKREDFISSETATNSSGVTPPARCTI